ncbi:MAG: FHA domain-containing protein [Bacteroidota bacterium]
MPIKLLVTHTGDSGAPDEYVFDQGPVTIGRDGDNALTLPDPSRVLSKHHAEVRGTDGAYYLADLGSKNFTFLNGKRLPSDQPARLSPGDSFKLGDFEVTFYPQAAPEPRDDRTVFAASFANPFDEVAEKLAASLGAMRRVWEAEGGAHRAEALREALGAAVIGGGDEPDAVVAALLGGGVVHGEAAAPEEAWSPAASPAPDQPSPDEPGANEPMPFADEPPASQAGSHPLAVTQVEPLMPPAIPPPDTPPPGIPPSVGPVRAEPLRGAELPREAPPVRHAAPEMSGLDGQADRVLDALLEVVSKLVSIPWQFRHEFIGQTIVQTDETAFLYETPPEELKALLLDTRDPAEAERRIGVLVDAADAVAVHQLAMLDGYKASVQDGAGRLLGQVDPTPLEEEIEASSPVYKVPQLRSVAVLDRLKELHQELGGEDWSVAERRAFRPAFIKAYLARMTRRRA